LLWGAGDAARPDAAASLTKTVSGVETTPVSYQPIEAVQVGDRVLTQATESQEAHDASTTSIHAPEAEPSSASSLDLDAEPVDPDTWKRVELRPVGDDPGRVEIVLLRPTWWLEANDARVGGRVDLHMPELGLSGPCRVEAIGPCPPIEPGPGRVVTGAFNRPGARVLDLYLEGEPKPIGTTANHPFYSIDRAAFVSAGDLAVGERLERLDGRPARVARLEARPGLQRVFNLEVHGEHVYRVADAGVLVHNSCPGRSNAEFEEGIYEFNDRTSGGLPYIGQSGQRSQRIRSHGRAGRMTPGTEKFTHVPGGKLERELAEMKRIQEITGGVSARHSSKVANKVDPIGPKRRPSLGMDEPLDH